MICDFNVSYSEAGLLHRAELVITHAFNIPRILIKSIIDIAHLALVSLAYCLTFGQSELFKHSLGINGIMIASQVSTAALAVFGLLAPINAARLQINSGILFSQLCSGLYRTMNCI